MDNWLLAILKRFRPDIETQSELNRSAAALDLFGILYSAPMALIGLVWLFTVSDGSLLRREWRMLLLLFIFLSLFKFLRFFYFIETGSARQSQFDASLEPIVTWSAALIFGPTSLWMAVLLDIIAYAQGWRRAASTQERWETIRNLLQNLAIAPLASLIALSFYQRLGGVFPLPGLTREAILPALFATLVHLLLYSLVFAPMLVYIAMVWTKDLSRGSGWLGALTWGLGIMVAATSVVEVFAILAAGLYAQNGPGVYIFFLSGVLVVSWLAHKLSQVVERSQQRSRELDWLEQLGRAILNAPPDASTLPELLKEHIPGMLPLSRIEIHLYPDQTILHHPENWPPVSTQTWGWLRANPGPNTFLPKTTLPWDNQMDQDAAIALVPIGAVENTGGPPSTPIGAVYLSRRRDAVDIDSLLPALQSLAAQVASAQHRAEVYRIEQELAVAGRIQASFLPDSLPQIPGWQLAAALEPARETSGDFYDVIPLPNGAWGILIADVADKGTGAALYMAMSRTLIRTYAVEYETQPSLALEAANRRIQADASADLFVTVFYGVLDPMSGTLTYCNGGHNPPYLFNSQERDGVQALGRTGLPLGILEDQTWEEHTVQLSPGYALVLYTDGITDAQNQAGAFFDTEGLLEVLGAHRRESAQNIQAALLTAVHEFTVDAPHAQQDDITVMILVREPI